LLANTQCHIVFVSVLRRATLIYLVLLY
jgi:hypothetical protein